jgi:hypothetical protein
LTCADHSMVRERPIESFRLVEKRVRPGRLAADNAMRHDRGHQNC